MVDVFYDEEVSPALSGRCEHTSSIVVEQIEGNYAIEHLYVAQCENCGEVGPLRANVQEAQRGLLKLGMRQPWPHSH